MELRYSKKFKKDIVKVKDNKLKKRIKKGIIKIMDNPTVGKPLKYELKGLRSIKIPPFRIVYEYNKEENYIKLVKFEHREKVY
ncbi:MAG: type II toxin-antitoxin system RelE/ParE family toxin [Methanosarcinales archaeon]